MQIFNKLRNKILGNHKNPKIDYGKSEFEVNNWIISDFIFKKLSPISGAHPFPLTELHLMTATVCYLQPEQIFEWGTNIGKSARIFYEITKYFNIKTSIHSIDLPDDIAHEEHPYSKRGYLVRNLSNVHLHQGDGVATAANLFSQNAQKKTLFFLDGDHSYSSVANEISKIIKLAPNAWILIHDTFYQSESSKYNIGPYRAIQEALLENPGVYKIKSSDLGLPGMTLLYK